MPVQLSKMIPNLSVHELSCIIIGMKKVNGIAIQQPDLRNSLYNYIMNLTKRYPISNEAERSDYDNLISLVLPILEHGGLIKNDSQKYIIDLMDSFYKICDLVSVQTLNQILLLTNYHNISTTI